MRKEIKETTSDEALLRISHQFFFPQPPAPAGDVVQGNKAQPAEGIVLPKIFVVFNIVPVYVAQSRGEEKLW